MNQDSVGYIDKILGWYVSLPDTPLRSSRYDRQLAIELCRRQVPLALVESAFLLATARRRLRDSTRPPLPPVRSLHYFLPIIEEVLASPPANGYSDYLREKLRRHRIYPAPKPAAKTPVAP